MPDTARTLQTMIRGPHSLVGQHAAEVLEVVKQFKEKAVMSAPGTSLSVLEKSEIKSIPVTEASDGLSAEMDIVNTITTQPPKTVSDFVSTDVPELMEEDVKPVSAGREDVDTKFTSVVEPGIEKEQPGADSKAEIGKTTSIKEITVGPSMSPQVMVKRSSVEDASPASTINIRKLNAAVVKRASVPSLALFGGSSKKKGPCLNMGSSTETKANETKTVETKPNETKPVEMEPVETNVVEASSRPGTSSAMTDSEVANLLSESSQASKLSNALVQDIPEGVIVTAQSNCVDDGNGGSARAVPSSSLVLSEKDSMTGAAGVADQTVEVKESAASRMVSEGGTASVTSEVILSTSLAAADGLIEHEESKSAAAVETPSQDAGRLNEAYGSDEPLSGSHNGEAVVMVAAEEEKASDTRIVNSVEEDTKVFDSKAVNAAVSPGGNAAVKSNPTIAVVNSRRVPGVARQGLGSMLGSSAHRKRQKRSNEDMEMVRLLPYCFDL